MTVKIIMPKRDLEAFTCPFCGVHAVQMWAALKKGDTATGYHGNVCSHCKKTGIWLDDKLIFPYASNTQLPSIDMPESIKKDFEEARNILNLSPKAAAALLRLTLQRLIISLGGKGENLNDDIGSLVKKGLAPEVQKALDIVRVMGNNAVHPGQIDLNDNQEIAFRLFDLVNFIVEQMITRPRELEELYSNLPSSSLEAIQKRDDNSPSAGG